jgi:hypothetical protein
MAATGEKHKITRRVNSKPGGSAPAVQEAKEKPSRNNAAGFSKEDVEAASAGCNEIL